ncbi:hypothetical protein E2562_014613 [Oryza meyeriana var. granulata]|uniref:Uncharacterized protein n=1 Tax=Oryza meyeriana var. granulata TaxID=110450 RepID=A0A6G1DXP8_9ORYZ|nr:hypothetical protein E2562_014613 [Oryza meyeriana var. granulata]
MGPTDTSADHEKAVEDYVSSLSTPSMAMDHSRPLWELHVLNFPTAEATATVALRMHHSLGDGISLLSLLIACTRRADDPGALPALPSSGRRRAHAGPVYALPRPPLAPCSGRVAPFGEEGARRFVNRTLSLGDVKHVKNAMGCTVNDVLVGVSSAALSRYYFRRTGTGQNDESGKNNGVKCGNQFGYVILPFHLAKHGDPLEYVRKATKVTCRKKSSMESIFTYWSADMIVKIFGIKAAASLCYGMFSNTTLSFSNLAGPSEQIVFCGNPIVHIAPTSYGHSHALTMHWQSYMHIVKLALAVDETQFPDAHELLDDFTESLRLIREAASRDTEKAHLE